MTGHWFGSPRRLRLTFLATMVVLSVTLAWLGWSFLEQDRQLSSQQAVTWREASADLAVAAIERRIFAVEQELDRALETGAPAIVPPPGAVIVQFLDGRVQAWPEDRLAFYPDNTSRLDSPEAVAATRVAAAHLNRSDYPSAIRAYEKLTALGDASIVGIPAAIAGSLGALAVFEREGDQSGITRTAVTLNHDINSGRFRLTPAAYRHVAQETARVASTRAADAAVRLTLAEGVEDMWDRWPAEMTGHAGRSSAITTAGSVLLVWRSADRGSSSQSAMCNPFTRRRSCRLESISR